MSSTREIEKRVDALASTPPGTQLHEDARSVVRRLLDALEAGTVRAAEKDPATGEWRAVPWVKRGILLGFRVGGMIDMSIRISNEDIALCFFDKDTYPPRSMSLADGVRIVPGGSSIRRGAYVASGVVCMPPMYINVGAYVGSGTMIDSHALVGSCAQVGERVHLSAAAQLGGVLEPVNASPVVVEDDVVVGGNCGIYEGTVVRRRAVIGAGVVLTRGTPVYDLERQTVHRAENGKPLVIPENAVVVPGARAVKGEWGQAQGISLQTPVIVKYRDEKTDAATALESWLR
ncbi:MAG TPA: 2,3,4,5-tetrahydropyridine-2,6-dicarboxylate N-succinyltransferase [Gemmatimonadaceae bacterium]